MSVSDGQAVNAPVSNAAWISKNTDDTGLGIYTLANTDPTSGSIITNIQALMNQMRLGTGATESTPGTTYTSSQRILIGDTHQTAISKLDTAFNAATGHKHTGASGDGPAISSLSPNANTSTTGLYGLSILSSVAPQDVGSAGASGTANGFVSNANHVHKGVHSFSKTGGTLRYGDISLTAGSNVSIIDNSDGSLTLTASVSGGAVAGYVEDVTTVSGDYSLNSSHEVILAAVTGVVSALTLQLPQIDANYDKKIYTVEKITTATGRVSILPFAGDLINNATGTKLYSTYESVRLVGDLDHSTWWTVSSISSKVLARYTSSSATTVPNTGAATLIDYATKDFDTHNAVTTGASWKFTAPKAGKYYVSTQLITNGAAWTLGNFMQIDLYLNGLRDRSLDYRESPVTASYTLGVRGSSVINLSAGDYIYLTLASTRTGGNVTTLNDSTYTYIEIEEM